MKTLFIAMILILSYGANADEMVRLYQNEDSKEFLLPNKACNKTASVYLKMLDKLKKTGASFEELPIMSEKHKGQEIILTGEVIVQSGVRKIEITQTEKNTGEASTMYLAYPESPTLIEVKNESGPSLQIHVSQNCTKMGNIDLKVPFACDSSKGVKKVSITNPMTKNTTMENKLFARMKDIADFHKNNDINEKLKANNIGFPERFPRACLSNQTSEKFSSEEVFANFFPNKNLNEKRGNGFGGGTGTVKIVSTQR